MAGTLTSIPPYPRHELHTDFVLQEADDLIQGHLVWFYRVNTEVAGGVPNQVSRMTAKRQLTVN
jgi:hypothetical protein